MGALNGRGYRSKLEVALGMEAEEFGVLPGS